MTQAQKIIKYLAIAFAIFLIVTIISAILSGIYGLANALGLRNDNKLVINGTTILGIEDDNVIALDINVAYTNLIIKKGNTLKAETNNSNITCKQNNQNLQIKEKSHNWFWSNNEGDLIVYIPEDLQFDEVKINAGAGKINIENLNSKELELELGAGETEIKNLNVTRNCNLDGGAGKISILSGTIKNLDFDMGIGETNLTASLNGESSIDAGVGNVNITLLGEKQDYQVKIDKGLGNVSLDGEKLDMSKVYGTGKNYIKIDGGVGNIKVDFDN